LVVLSNAASFEVKHLNILYRSRPLCNFTRVDQQI
jgi:hypothetical protein